MVGYTTDTAFNIEVFLASDRTGATDVTSELKTLIESANGKYVRIPKGKYLLNDMDCNSDVLVTCDLGVEIVHDYGSRAIWQRNEDQATAAQDVSALSDVVWANSNVVTRLTVSNASAYAKGDVVDIHSPDNWLLSGDNRRIGQASKVQFVDTANNYVYLNERLILTPLLLTNVRLRKYGTRKFEWYGGHFSANGTYDDVSLGDGSSRRPCIDVYATPHAVGKNISFEGTWAQCFALRSCPYSFIDSLRSKELPNLLTEDATPMAITGITKASPGIVTVDDASSVSNGDDIVIYGIVGMTELNNKAFRVKNKSGNSFELDSYYQESGGEIDTTNFTTYISGGSVEEGDINALGYMVWLYASCCHTVVQNCTNEEGRHGIITSDGIGDSTYNDSEWATYGFPSHITVHSCVANNSYGIPFDTHEEALEWVFSDCHVHEAQRGPEGGSYVGCGFQDRGFGTKFVGCTVTGGSMGIRISPEDQPLQNLAVIHNCTFTNMRGKSDGESYAIRLLTEDQTPTNRTNVRISNVLIDQVGCGIHLDRGADATLGDGIVFLGVDECMDVAAGCEVVALGMVMFDFRYSPFSGNQYCVRMRSDGSNGGCNVRLLGGATIVKGSDSAPAELFYEADTTANKTYYTADVLVDRNGFTVPTLLSAGESTMVAYTDVATLSMP